MRKLTLTGMNVFNLLWSSLRFRKLQRDSYCESRKLGNMFSMLFRKLVIKVKLPKRCYTILCWFILNDRDTKPPYIFM